jgi:hypothetical protein
MSRPPPLEPDAASRLLPNFQFEERHSLQGIAGSQEHIIEAIANFDDRRDAVLSRLLWARELPGRWLFRLTPSRGIPPARERFGLADFVELERGPSEIAFGLAGKLWKMDFGLIGLADQQAFMHLSEPSIAKLVLTFRATPQAQDRCELETVTRVFCTDASSLRWMRAYWAAIRPFSGWVRGRILRQLKQSVEHRNPPVCKA